LTPGVRGDLVSVLDFAPTMLAVAGVAVPRFMHGRVLLGEASGAEPPYLFFHRDRMDEVYELQRAARDRRWKYIRNYEPEKTYAQRLDYMDAMPAMQDWRRLAAANRLAGGQKHWFTVPKPVEELYDTQKDPWELTNLAEQPEYAQRLKRMRAAVERWQEQIGDTGLVPEAVLMEEMKPGGETPLTQRPVIRVVDGVVSISSPTEGSSVVYQTRSGGDWGDWRLFTKSFSLPPTDQAVRAQASRLGYRGSPMVTWKRGP
jgi:hypothetical protein